MSDVAVFRAWVQTTEGKASFEKWLEKYYDAAMNRALEAIHRADRGSGA